MGLVIMIAAAFVMFLAFPFVLPSGAVMGEWVQLSFVHERFASELDRFYGRSVEPATGWNKAHRQEVGAVRRGRAILALLLSICFAGGETPARLGAHLRPDRRGVRTAGSIPPRGGQTLTLAGGCRVTRLRRCSGGSSAGS